MMRVFYDARACVECGRSTTVTDEGRCAECAARECVCPVCGFPAPVFTDGEGFFGFHYGVIGASGGVDMSRPCPNTWDRVSS